MKDETVSNENNSNTTSFVPAKCTNCGGELTVNPKHDAAICQFCGTPFIVAKAVQNYNIQHNTYQTKIINQAKKGAVESILDYVSERQDKRQQRIDEARRRAEEERIRQEEQRKKRNKNILWALGWIFFFPIPLTILLLRNKGINDTKDTKENISQGEANVNIGNTALWALGWILIFPVPLTILMLRKKDMNEKLKHGIIIAGWGIYLIYMLLAGINAATSPRDYDDDDYVSTTVSTRVPSRVITEPKIETIITETQAIVTTIKAEPIATETQALVTTVKETSQTETNASVENSTTSKLIIATESVNYGDSGVYAFKKKGNNYDQYWIIDVDEGYVYYFTYGDGNTDADKVKIESGDLNSVLIITYHDDGYSWSYGLHFKYVNHPDHLIMQDNDGFEYDYYPTDLSNALEILDTKNIHEY